MDKNEKQTEKKLDARDDITLHAKKERRRRFDIRLVIFAVFFIAIVLVIANWDKVISPLKDAALDVKKGGFPVDLPGSTGYVLDELGESFFLMTDTYLYTYSSEGGNIMSEQHGFQNPASSAQGGRVLIYDRNGHDFKCFSRTGEVFSALAEDTIVFGVMGPDERSAIVTTSTRFANTLYVYNAKGERIFRYFSPNKKIMQLCFSDNGKILYMTMLGEKGGELILSTARIDISTDTEDLLWETQVGSEMTYSVEACSDGVYVVTAGGNFLLDRDTGEVLSSGSFGRLVCAIPECKKAHYMIFRDSVTNGSIAVSYNSKLEAQNSVLLSQPVAFDTEGDKLYVLSTDKITSYNSSLEPLKKYELDDVYSDLKIIGNSVYLLGYNTVQQVNL